ncbi:MAG: type VI secretion system-associated protein TagF [Gammaproteobacteria bacterium]|nr:type VI secretion system-associated protein TagF [Gammaproteobacteria bacterium]MBU1440263.1 type VI secretion system-associated protein TagF [Gammaproteobacteria bacterium]MBU2285888.1 type VI secretion system-associated protein TagF [Gammaproteobacteria bacterium]
MTPGWFGKLPGMGDFAHRRLSEAFREAWDRWLQVGLARLRVLHADWTEHYLKAPIWYFVLGSNVIGAPRWIGVLMPSVDSVGRYFPFTVAAELDTVQTELQGDALARVRQWWLLAAQAALEGLEQDLDAMRFDELLTRLFAADAQAPAVDASGDSDGMTGALALPMPGQSLWFTDPIGESGPGMMNRGLPQDEQFDALFVLRADPLSGHDAGEGA